METTVQNATLDTACCLKPGLCQGLIVCVPTPSSYAEILTCKVALGGGILGGGGDEVMRLEPW